VTGAANPRLTLSYWQRMIGGSTLGLTAQEVERAAQRAVLETREGRDTCAWHEAARVKGTKCNCARCVKARGERPQMAIYDDSP
jgi:hypothetical protein